MARRALDWAPSGVPLVNAALRLAFVETETAAGDEAARLLGRLFLELETIPDVQYAAPTYEVAASLALWRGDLADAERAARAAWDRIRDTEDWPLAARSATTVLRVAAAQVRAAGQRNDLAAMSAARSWAAPGARRRRAHGGEGRRPRRRAGPAGRRGRPRHGPGVLRLACAAPTTRRRGRRPRTSGARSSSRTTWPGLASTRPRPILAGAPVGRAHAATGASTPARRCSNRRRSPSSSAPSRSCVRSSTSPSGPGSSCPSDRPRPRGRRGPRRLPRRPRPPVGADRATRADSLPRLRRPFGLSPREQGVLAEIVAGRTNREIGERLFISEKTVGVHVGNILAKLGVGGRVEAATVALRLGLVDDRLERTKKPGPSWSGLPRPAARRRRLSGGRGEGTAAARLVIYQRDP